MSCYSRRDFLTGPLVVTGLATLAPTLALGSADTPAAASTPSGAFLEAVRTGNLDRARSLIARDPGLLYARDSDGRTAFTLAALARHFEIGQLLRERGYRPDLHESALILDWERMEKLALETPGALNRDHPCGGTAMFAAATGGAGSEIWRVYRYGGDPNANPRESPLSQPLRAALGHPDLSRAELTAAALLGNGAAPESGFPNTTGALHLAASRGSFVVTEMLLRKGAQLDRKDENDKTPRDLAEKAGHEEIVELLDHPERVPKDHSTSRRRYDLEGKPFVPADLGAFSAIAINQLVGAAHFNLDAVRKTVERHPSMAKAMATTTEGAVEACAHTGRKEIVDYLLKRGAPYSISTATLRDDRARVKTLLEEDPLRIHERGPHDFALLWYPVIGGGLLEIASLLLDAGAKVDHQHHLGTTALHFAARGGQHEMAELLIDRGAEVQRVGRKFDPKGQTPLDLAKRSGDRRMIGLLKSRGAKS